jgi:hypothetical protein
MTKRLLTTLAFSFMIGAAWAQTDAPAPAPDPAPGAEQVLIVGQRPGPGLWKISKGDHVLWVFGAYAPLPKKMEWRSHEVETILAQSQEYLVQPMSGAGIGFWSGLKLLPQLPRLWGIKNNPDGAKLKDVLPPETYARWLVLKEKYIGKNDDIENERPFFAAETLYSRGLDHMGLTPGSNLLHETIDRLVKQAKVKVTFSRYQIELKDAGQMLKDFKRSPMEDAACFAKTLDGMESDIDQMRVRANAWAIGDIAQIRKLDFADREHACQEALLSSAAVKGHSELQEMQRKMQELWLANAEKALDKNASTFAMLKMNDILAPDGLVAALQAKGYQVASPE